MGWWWPDAGLGALSVVPQLHALDFSEGGHHYLHYLDHSLKVKVKSLRRVRLFATPWTVAYQAPPSMGFSRKECWSGLPFPSPVDHILSELSTMTRLSWVALHGMAHSFIELDKAVVPVIR